MFNYFFIIIVTAFYITNYILNLIYLKNLKHDADVAIDKYIPLRILKKLSISEKEQLRKSFDNMPGDIIQFIKILLVEVFFVILLNALFLSSNARNLVFKGFAKILKMLKIQDSDHEIFALRIFYFLSLGFTGQRIIKFNFTQFNSLLMGILFVLVFIPCNLYITRNPKKIKIKYILLGLTLYQLFKLFKSMVENQQMISSYKAVPKFLTGEALIEAQRFFGNEIYYIPETNFSCNNFLFFHKTKLVLSGDWSNLNNDEIMGLIGHEIGHGSSIIRMIFITIKMIAINVSLFICFNLIKSLSTCIKPEGIPNNTISSFIFLINLPVVLMVKYFADFFSLQLIEFFADIRSYYIFKNGDLSTGLLKYSLRIEDFVFRPLFYSIFNETHPSTMLRIKILERLKYKV